MTTPSPTQRVPSLLLVAICLATAGMAYLYGVTDLPFESDNQHYFFMAERTASGVVPYEAHFDAKSGLSMLLTGGAIYTGRLLGVSDVTSARVLSSLVLAFTLWLVWRLTQHLTRSTRAAAFASLTMLGFSGYWYLGLMGSRPKVFLVLLIVWTIILFLQKRDFAAGLVASLAFLTWQPALLMLALMVTVVLLRQRRLRGVGRLLTGAMIPVTVYVLYFLGHGSFQEMVIQTLYFPAKYMRHGIGDPIRAANKIWFLWGLGFGAANVLPWVALIGIVGSGVALLRRVNLGGALQEMDPDWLFLGLCLLGWAAFTWHDHQGYPDLFVLLPFISVLAGYTLDRCLVRCGRLAPVIVAVALCYFGFLIFHGSRLHDSELTLHGQQRLAKRVERMIRRGRTVYTVGFTHLLAFNRTSNWVKYGYFFRGLDLYLMDQNGGAIFTPETEGQWPSVVILSWYTSNNPEGYKTWLEQHYRQSDEELFIRHNVLYYRLKKKKWRSVDTPSTP